VNVGFACPVNPRITAAPIKVTRQIGRGDRFRAIAVYPPEHIFIHRFFRIGKHAEYMSISLTLFFQCCLSFTIPAAKAWIHGTYDLIDYKIDFHGTLLTTGNPWFNRTFP
jgi:hypothetical protein